MKKAIQIGYGELFEDRCKAASEAGFSEISVNYTAVPKTEREDGWKRVTEDIMRITEQNKLRVVQSHPHYYDLHLSSEIIDEDMEFAMRQSIISSAALGAEFCVFHPRSSISSGYLRSRSLEDNIKWFSSLLECAVKHGTAVAAENLPVFRTNDRRMPLFASGVEDLSDLVCALGDEHAVVCWDFGHSNLMHYEQKDAIRHLGSYLKCTHIHDNFANDDSHSPLGCGNIDWNAAMGALADIGYGGPLTLEVEYRNSDPDLMRAATRYNFASLEYLERLFKK